MSLTFKQVKARKEEMVSAIMKAAGGKERLALECMQEAIQKLASIAGEDTACMGKCPYCQGSLHLLWSGKIALLYLNQGLRAAAVLKALSKAQKDGWLLGLVERAIGQDIPTLEKLYLEDIPIYVCSGCGALTVHKLDSHQIAESL